MIDELIKNAAKALAAEQYFEAEQLANKALDLAREDDDFARMAAVIPTLQAARTARLEQAVKAGTVTIVDEPFSDRRKIKPGCYLVQPPLVGADARRLRLMAFSRKVPAVVLCREPVIRLGLMPVVALGNSATIRNKVDLPDSNPQRVMQPLLLLTTTRCLVSSRSRKSKRKRPRKIYLSFGPTTSSPFTWKSSLISMTLSGRQQSFAPPVRLQSASSMPMPTHSMPFAALCA